MKKCGAKTRAGGECKKAPMENGRCKLHGGMSLKGIAHPNYQGKGYSRYVPKPLGPAITAFLESGDPLSMVDAIATWEGRVDALLRSLESEGSEKAWEELAEEWVGFWKATDAEDRAKVQQHREAIDGLIVSGQVETETWRQIQAADEQRRKLIDSEDKKRERRRGWMRAEEIRYQNQALQLAVIEGVGLIEDDKLQRKVRSKIAERFIQIVGPAALPGPTAAADRD